MRERPGDDVYFDANGCLAERVRLGDQLVVVHYADVPAEDLTVVQGIPCTTALRTVIDLAPECEPGELERIVRDALDRGLFSIDEARARLAKPDMRSRPGAVVLRRVLDVG